MSKTPLRAVTDRDVPPQKPVPTSLKAAAESSERDLLVMMRNKIFTEIENGVPAHTLAPLMRQVREIDKEIRSLDARARQESAGSDAPVDNSYDASAI